MPASVLYAVTAPSLETADVTLEGISEAYVDPVLLKDEYYKFGGLVAEGSYLQQVDKIKEFLANLGVKSLGSMEGIGRVIIVASPKTSLDKVRTAVKGLINRVDMPNGLILVAWVTKEDIEKLAKVEGVVAILPDVRLDTYIEAERRREIEALESATLGSEAEPDTYFAVNITGARNVWETYGFTGEGVKLAIIDTGVDYASPALGLNAIARDEYGLPLILDDGLGLALTPVAVEPNATGYIEVNTTQLLVYDPLTGVYTTNYGWVYDLYSGNSTVFPVDTWYVGNIPHYGPMKFGLQVQLVIVYNIALYMTVPVLVVNSSGYGYDTVYVDMTTAYHYIATVLNMTGYSIPDLPGTPDFNFSDESPVYYGNEITGLDLDGDGYYDFSLGTLAGYYYDPNWALYYYKAGMPGYYFFTYEYWSYDSIALIWPGLDPEGDYLVLSYDFMSHGTSCAATAAGRLDPYYIPFGQLPGQAPSVKIASANALWYGDIITSLLFFSGHDLYGFSIWSTETFEWPVGEYGNYGEWTWVYRGRPRVDITSNSYGISTWLLTFWGSSYDPWSQFYDFVSLKTGLINVIAAGNGGYGWGTVTTPGSSLMAITVGASTEFLYRAWYGYIGGGYDDVISWSARGPTSAGLPKPDVVAIGSNAWAGAYTWMSLLNYGAFSSYFAWDLFGGTSQATPMVAGAVAIIVEAYKQKYNRSPRPEYVKMILKESADDLGYGPLAQGSGRINLTRALDLVMQREVFLAYTFNTYKLYRREMSNLGTFTGYRSRAFVPDSTIYFGDASPGSSRRSDLVLVGSGTYNLTPIRLVENWSTSSICDYIIWDNSTPTDAFNGCDANGRLLINSSALEEGTSMIFALNETLFENADLVEVFVNISYEYFAPDAPIGNYTYNLWFFSELGFAYDVSGDNVIQTYEIARMQLDSRRANTQRLTLGKPLEKFMKAREIVAYVLGVPEYVMDYFGNTTTLRIYTIENAYYNTTGAPIIPLTVTVKKYKFETWDWVTAISPLNVRRALVTSVTISVPSDALPGYYSGYLKIQRSDGYTVLLPMAVNVKFTIDNVTPVYLPTTPLSDDIYKNYEFRAAYDWNWRYESGDWRIYKFDVTDSDIKGIVLWVLATDPYDNLDVAVIGPKTITLIDNSTGMVQDTYKVKGSLHALHAAYYSIYEYQGYLPYPDFGVAALYVPTPETGTYTLIVRMTNAQSPEEYAYIMMFPVAIHVPSEIAVPRTGTTAFNITIETSTDLLNLSPIYVLGRGIRNNLYYEPNLTAIGINITTIPGMLYFTQTLAGTYEAVFTINITTISAPRGIYKTALLMRPPLPWLFLGEIWYDPTYGPMFYAYYYSDVVPIEFTFKVI
jgi:subtilisin family serine protease